MNKNTEFNIKDECVCRVGRPSPGDDICIWFCADTVKKYPTLKNEMPAHWHQEPLPSNRIGMYFRLVGGITDSEILINAMGETLTELGFSWVPYWNNEDLFLILVDRHEPK